MFIELQEQKIFRVGILDLAWANMYRRGPWNILRSLVTNIVTYNDCVTWGVHGRSVYLKHWIDGMVSGHSIMDKTQFIARSH